MLDMLIGPVTNLLDKFIPDADEKARLAHEISTMATRHAHELAKEQISINREEAKHIPKPQHELRNTILYGLLLITNRSPWSLIGKEVPPECISTVLIKNLVWLAIVAFAL